MPDPVHRLGSLGPGVLALVQRDLDRRGAPPAVGLGPVDAHPTVGGQGGLPAPGPRRPRRPGRRRPVDDVVVGQPRAERGGELLVLLPQREVHGGPVDEPDIGVTLVGCRVWCPAVTAPPPTDLGAEPGPHATAGPAAPGTCRTLDALISAHGGEVVDGDARLSADPGGRAGGRRRGRPAGARRHPRATRWPGRSPTAWPPPSCLGPAGASGRWPRRSCTPSARRTSRGPWGRSTPRWSSSSHPTRSRTPPRWSTPSAVHPSPPGPVPAVPPTSPWSCSPPARPGTPKAVLHTQRGLSWKAALMARVHGLGSGGCGAHAGADGPHLGPAQRRPGAGRGRDALGPRPPLRPRAGPRPGGARADLVPRRPARPSSSPWRRALAEGPAVDVSSVRLVSSGGASVTPAFVEDTARTFDCRVKRTYGSTEAPTVTTSTDDDPFEKARDTDGRAVGEVELRVSDPRPAHRCATGTAGRAVGARARDVRRVRRRGARPAAVIARGGWFRTGDLATVDADGWVRIVGRLKDVIIRGGENISASEVEAALEAHPDDPPRGGRRLSRPADGRAGGRLRRVRRTVRPRGVPALVRRPWSWPPFKTPEKVERLDHLPLLGSGKADRAALRRRAAAS